MRISFAAMTMSVPALFAVPGTITATSSYFLCRRSCASKLPFPRYGVASSKSMPPSFLKWSTTQSGDAPRASKAARLASYVPNLDTVTSALTGVEPMNVTNATIVDPTLGTGPDMPVQQQVAEMPEAEMSDASESSVPGQGEEEDEIRILDYHD